MSRLFSINFKILPEAEAVIPVMDRSFLYGDSVYEVIRTYQGKQLFALPQHFKRLQRSAEALGIDIPFSMAELQAHLGDCLGQIDHGDSYIRIVVSRGTDDRFSLMPQEHIKPTTVILLSSLPVIPKSDYEEGIKVALVSVRRNHPRSLDPSLKTGNYINNMLALMEANRTGGKEAIMLNHDGFVTEATTSNVFMVKNEVVFTPELRAGILEGVTRSILKELLREENIPFEETMLTEAFFLSAEEIFITGTIKEIMPAVWVNDQRVGNGKPGKMTQKLMKAFSKRTLGS